MNHQRLPLQFLSIFIILATTPIAFAANFVEIPQVPDSSKHWTGWFLSSNDGFGHNYGTDEDNLRTYGINAGLSLPRRLLVHTDWTSFTDRNRSYERSLRNDELKLMAAFPWLYQSNSTVTALVYSGAGALFYGNFGTLKIQESAHGINNQHTRPIPHTYDDPSSHFLAYLYSELYFPRSFINLRSYAHVTHTTDFNLDLTANCWVIARMLQSSFALSYKWNSVKHAGKAIENCYNREDGLWLSNKTFIGFLMVERGVNLDNLHQYSFAGFRIGDFRHFDKPVSPFGLTYSIGWPIGHNSWIEFFRIYPWAEIEQLGLFLRTYSTENLIENNITHLDSDRHVRRTKETSIGAEISFFDPAVWTLLDGFLFAGTGFTRDMITTYDQLEARMLDRETRFMVHGGAGIRLMIPDVIFKKKGRAIGAELVANVRCNSSSTGIFSNPDLLLNWGLVFTER